MSVNSYPTLEDKFEKNIRFFFISTGKEVIIKAVDYTHVSDYNGKKIFNLAFGDYDDLADKINDAAHSNNGDVYKVFNTVLSTIPKFFATFRNEIMMVQGSDSRQDFLENCKIFCQKGCENAAKCKNKDRRINVYTRYVNANYDKLTGEYVFYGGVKYGNMINIEIYSPTKKYDSVFVFKK